METIGQFGTGNLIGDITDEEIQEWKNSGSGVTGMYFAGLAAEAIRKGTYSPGQEIYGTRVREWLCNGADGMSPKTFESAMKMLADRNMVRVVKRRSTWDWEKVYYVADGETEP
jgi:hypothetical protein